MNTVIHRPAMTRAKAPRRKNLGRDNEGLVIGPCVKVKVSIACKLIGFVRWPHKSFNLHVYIQLESRGFIPLRIKSIL